MTPILNVDTMGIGMFLTFLYWMSRLFYIHIKTVLQPPVHPMKCQRTSILKVEAPVPVDLLESVTVFFMSSFKECLLRYSRPNSAQHCCYIDHV